MAARKGQNITKLDDSPARKPQSSFAHGRVRVWMDTYNTADGLTAGDTLTIARLPKGAVVLGGQVDWESLTAANKLEVVVGDSHDTDRFLTTTVIPNAASSNTVRGAAALGTYGGFGANCGIFSVFDTDSSDAASNRAGFGYEYTCEKDIILTVTNGTSTAGYIRTAVYYSTE
jgi:hypothetical protein